MREVSRTVAPSLPLPDAACPEELPKPSYARFATPSVTAAEERVKALEGAAWSLLVSSGMSAVDLAFSILQPRLRGRPWLVADAIYEGSRSYILGVAADLRGAPISWMSGAELALPDGSTRFGARIEGEVPGAIFFETMSNPFMLEPDLGPTIAAARRCGAHVVIDNTVATHLRATPLAAGADLVVTSATKYLSGHGDLLAGIVFGNDPTLEDEARGYRGRVGTILNPRDAELLASRLDGFSERFERQSRTAAAVASYLDSQPKVSEVWYPAPRPDDGPTGALVTFMLRGHSREARSRATATFLRAVGDVLPYKVSFGSVESSIVDLSTLMPRAGHEGVLRLSVGLEDGTWITDVLERGLLALEVTR